MVTVLLAGELKLIPIPLSMLFRTRELANRHTLQVQTILLAGLCAHPSISGLGEPVIMQSSDKNDNSATCDLAILCRPKLNEIGYKDDFSSSSFTGLMSTQKAVSFSPVEHIQEISATRDSRKPAHFFAVGSKTPGRKVENASYRSEWETPRILTTPKIQIISPESEEENTLSAKPQDQEHHQSNNERCKNQTAGEPPFLSPLDSLARSTSTVVGSPLVGLDLLSSRSGMAVNNDSTIIITNTSNRDEGVDLAKWSPTSSNLNLTPLSGGLISEISNAERSATSQVKSNMLSTPANAALRGFAPHSALKSIQCTTPAPAKAEHELTRDDINPDELSHIVVVRVGQEISDGKGKQGEAQLKIEFSSVSLPRGIAKFDSASLQWEADTNSGKNLIVATTEVDSLKLLKLSLRDGDIDSTECDTLSLHDLGPLFAELGREKKWSFKVKGVSIHSSRAALKEDPGNLNVRFLLYRQVERKEDSSTMSSPINMSSTEATRVSLLASSLPLVTAQPLTTSGGANQDLAKKLDQIMNFMKGFEAKVDLRMDDLECRLGRLEESMRTV